MKNYTPTFILLAILCCAGATGQTKAAGYSNSPDSIDPTHGKYYCNYDEPKWFPLWDNPPEKSVYKPSTAEVRVAKSQCDQDIDDHAYLMMAEQRTRRRQDAKGTELHRVLAFHASDSFYQGAQVVVEKLDGHESYGQSFFPKKLKKEAALKIHIGKAHQGSVRLLVFLRNLDYFNFDLVPEFGNQPALLTLENGKPVLKIGGKQYSPTRYVRSRDRVGL